MLSGCSAGYFIYFYLIGGAGVFDYGTSLPSVVTHAVDSAVTCSDVFPEVIFLRYFPQGVFFSG